MSEYKLKPCPFCGGEAKVMNMGYPHWVFCKNCYAKVHGRTHDEKDSVDAWNRRQIDTDRLKISKSLKPCPFCGGKAELEEDMGYPYVVSCKKCGARVTSLENDKKGSVDAWNRRKE